MKDGKSPSIYVACVVLCTPSREVGDLVRVTSMHLCHSGFDSHRRGFLIWSTCHTTHLSCSADAGSIRCANVFVSYGMELGQGVVATTFARHRCLLVFSTDGETAWPAIILYITILCNPLTTRRRANHDHSNHLIKQSFATISVHFPGFFLQWRQQLRHAVDGSLFLFYFG